MEEEYLRPAEIAAKMKISRQTVYNWMRSGALEYRRTGNTVLITPAALEACIASGGKKREIAQ